MNDLLIFNKERTLGQTISFAFLIFRKNQKNFWKGFAAAVLPWIIAAAILITPFIVAKSKGNGPNMDTIAFLLFLSICLYLFGFLVLNTYINEYIISVKNNSVDQKTHYKIIVKATYKAVPKNMLNFFLNTILYFLLMGIISIVFWLCMMFFIFSIATGSVILIGIAYIISNLLFWAMGSYISACTGPIIFISQYEKVHFFKALEINFSYLHGRKGFWASILVTLFGFLLMWIISINLSTSITLVYGIIEYNAGNITTNEKDIFNIGKIIYLVMAISWPLSSFIMMMIFGANYFSQKEKALGIGLKEKIEKIGENKDYDSSKLEINF